MYSDVFTFCVCVCSILRLVKSFFFARVHTYRMDEIRRKIGLEFCEWLSSYLYYFNIDVALVAAAFFFCRSASMLSAWDQIIGFCSETCWCLCLCYAYDASAVSPSTLRPPILTVVGWRKVFDKTMSINENVTVLSSFYLVFIPLCIVHTLSISRIRSCLHTQTQWQTLQKGFILIQSSEIRNEMDLL